MRSSLRLLAVATVAVLASLSPARSWAQWGPDGAPVQVAPFDQLNPSLCSDGKGGTIIVWSDSDTGPYAFDIYAQRLNAFGFPLWGNGGVPVCTSSGDQVRPVVTADGSGGAIIAWEDFRNGNDDVFVQRLDSLGVRQWNPVQGVPMCTDSAGQGNLEIVGDNAGGAIVAWEDFRTQFVDIYGQRVNAAGVMQWTANGRGICTEDDDQVEVVMIADGAGGAILAWQDLRNFEGDIFAQRINGTGAGLWGVNGRAVCDVSGTQRVPVIAPDSARGAIIAWEDFRDEIFSFDIYVQRVNFGGFPVWTADGVALVSEDSDQEAPVMVSDGAGGAIVAWEDNRAVRTDIYARRVNQAGVPQWTVDGVPVCTVEGTQDLPEIVSDGASGAIVLWEDLRHSIAAADLYGQRLNAAGQPLWQPNGLAFTQGNGEQVSAAMISDDAGGAIAAWVDTRSGTSTDIHAQRVSAGGIVGPTTGVADRVPRSFELLAVHPNPSRGATRVRFEMARAEDIAVEVFDLSGRRVRELSRGVRAAGTHAIGWDGRDAAGAPVEGGLYWLRVSGTSGTAASKVAILH